MCNSRQVKDPEISACQSSLWSFLYKSVCVREYERDAEISAVKGGKKKKRENPNIALGREMFLMGLTEI